MLNRLGRTQAVERCLATYEEEFYWLYEFVTAETADMVLYNKKKVHVFTHLSEKKFRTKIGYTKRASWIRNDLPKSLEFSSAEIQKEIGNLTRVKAHIFTSSKLTVRSGLFHIHYILKLD